MTDGQTLGRAALDGVLLAGLLVSGWDLGDVEAASPWGAGLQAVPLAVPGGLLLVARWGHVPVPWGVWAVSVLGAWLWVSARWGLAVTGVGAAGWVLSQSPDTWESSAVVGQAVALVGLGLLAALGRRVLPRRPTVWIGGCCLAMLGLAGWAWWSGGWQPAMVTSGVSALLVGGYAVSRGQRAVRLAQARQQAEFDALTGARTRVGLARWRQQLPSGTVGCVIAVDLDDFKTVNDTWGHPVGDAVLREAGRRLRDALRPEDVVARPGGDEFTVWIPGVQEDAAEVAERLHAAVSGLPYPVGEDQTPLTASVGWATGPLDGATAVRADQALLVAKRVGKNLVCGPDAVRRAGIHRDGPEPWVAAAAERLWAAWQQPALLVDRRGRLLAANSALERLTGQTRAALLGTPITGGAVGPETDDREPPGEYRQIRRPQRPDGTRWWALETFHSVRDARQRLRGYWATVQAPLEARLAGEATPVAGWEALAIRPVFQPIVDVREGCPIGFEALARPVWNGDLVAPAELFAVAAATRSVPVVDIRCLEAVAGALETGARWPAGQRLFLNIRLVTIMEARRRLEGLRQRLEALVGSGSCVWEVAETDRMAEADAWIGLRVSWPGAQWAVDDWGAGWHDLGRLLDLHPQWIKVDRSWIVAAARNPAAEALLAALAGWAHQQGHNVVAEGVETEAERAVTLSVGIRYAQGYYWARPAPWPEEGPALHASAPRGVQ
ncbi:MAG: EAL domain-containing protein [Firmicutes bacterium]|nr:EAL domain-containing protein [Bacillota bacterium]